MNTKQSRLHDRRAARGELIRLLAEQIVQQMRLQTCENPPCNAADPTTQRATEDGSTEYQANAIPENK